MGQRVGEHSEERFVGGLLINPLHGTLVYEVGRVILAVLVAFAIHRVVNIVYLHLTAHILVHTTSVGIEKVGIVEVSLELAYIAIIFIYTSRVRCRDRALIAASPLTEHTSNVAIVLHDFGQNDMRRIIRLLARLRVVLVVAIHNATAPILVVATHLGVARVLASHERSTRRSTHGATGIGLGEAHTLTRHTVEVGGVDILLPVATHIGIAEVVAHNINNVGTLCLRRLLCLHAWSGHQSATKKEPLFVVHSYIVFILLSS